MLGVLFRVNGLRPFIKQDASEFHAQFVDAPLIFGPQIKILIEQLQDTPEIERKIDRIESFLTSNLKGTIAPKYLPFTLKKLSGDLGPKGQVSRTCKDAGISNKSLVNTFQKHIGVNPMKYAHLQAVNKAITLLAENPGQSLTDLTYRLNFYDQAHFSSLFKSFTTLTPSSFSVLASEQRVDPTMPNFILLQG
jgi:AraC-like DNA-binding protein